MWATREPPIGSVSSGKGGALKGLTLTGFYQLVEELSDSEGYFKGCMDFGKCAAQCDSECNRGVRGPGCSGQQKGHSISQCYSEPAANSCKICFCLVL